MNYIKKLEELTSIKGWKSCDGLDSKCGIDYYFSQGKNNSAYVNDDQGYVTICVNGVCLFADFV